MNIFVGNLSFEATVEDLRHAFERFGRVADARVIRDRISGRSKGFGFVDMPDEAEANAAILALNSQEFGGRRINVNPARPRGRR